MSIIISVNSVFAKSAKAEEIYKYNNSGLPYIECYKNSSIYDGLYYPYSSNGYNFSFKKVKYSYSTGNNSSSYGIRVIVHPNNPNANADNIAVIVNWCNEKGNPITATSISSRNDRFNYNFDKVIIPYGGMNWSSSLIYISINNNLIGPFTVK